MKIIYIYLATFFLFGLTSCNDAFMDKYPLDKVNDQNYWKSVDDLKTYANQFYYNNNTSQLAYNLLDALDGFKVDDRSDNQANSEKYSYIWNETVVPAEGKDNGWGKADWEEIRSCNFFLQRCHMVEGDNNKINQYVGEVLMFKAIHYFRKVTLFGDVPWLTTDLTTDSEALYAPRDSRILVVDSINTCLDKAIAYLPESSSEGRLTKYAALAFKSRVCLYEGTYRKYHNMGDYERLLRQSAEASLAIMESGLFDLYSTGDPEEDYHAFFQLQDMSGVNEAIFFIRYITDKRQHNRVRQVREGGTGMTKDFVESYLCRTDGKPISVSADYKGDAVFMDEFENRDYRMKQTIYTPDRPIFITEDGTKEYEQSPIFNNLTFTGYRMYKMYSPLASDNEFVKCTIDDCVYRYAEVLLNYAEAKAELNECDQAVLDITINKLRDRVAMPHMIAVIPFVDPSWPNWEVGVNPLINEIRRERRIELACEGFR